MKAIFAGTFDPFTLGHLDIVNRAAKVFDFVHISILYNPGKDGELFTVSEREDLIRDAVS
ncbi:MAG: adenylyltransferase/cytidyltransferase family protein, partial [Clostridiales bacterium]|nr:adenylyltransferase/cytidyltransferase family protein [Clostridiales bacterium]MDY5702132.1 adenylyltransferase/cytidyltransferase family protein [Eubacteriales bacterium]